MPTAAQMKPVIERAMATATDPALGLAMESTVGDFIAPGGGAVKHAAKIKAVMPSTEQMDKIKEAAGKGELKGDEKMTPELAEKYGLKDNKLAQVMIQRGATVATFAQAASDLQVAESQLSRVPQAVEDAKKADSSLGMKLAFVKGTSVNDPMVRGQLMDTVAGELAKNPSLIPAPVFTGAPAAAATATAAAAPGAVPGAAGGDAPEDETGKKKKEEGQGGNPFGDFLSNPMTAIIGLIAAVVIPMLMGGGGSNDTSVAEGQSASAEQGGGGLFSGFGGLSGGVETQGPNGSASNVAPGQSSSGFGIGG